MIGPRERAAVADVLNGTVLVHGPRAVAFERAFEEWAGGGHAVAVGSCTAGLHLLNVELGLGPGDEVIVPAQTHVATAHAVEFTGAKPVFVDADVDTGNLDVDALADAITERTRAIVPVHFLGLPVDMDRIGEIASRHGLSVFEDAALAVGTRQRGVHAGLLGGAGVFSFYPVKHFTTGEGGMILTQDPKLAARLAKRRAFGVDRTVEKRDVPGHYDVTMLGYNYRMNELAAALGVEQLRRVPQFLERRRANFTALAEALAGVDDIRILATGGDSETHTSSHYCLSVVLSNELASARNTIVEAIGECGVGTSIYYPRPVPHMTYYRDKYGYSSASFPNAARISNRSIALPVGPHLDLNDMQYVAASLTAAIAKVR